MGPLSGLSVRSNPGTTETTTKENIVLKDILPATVRKPAYLVYALLGLTLTATVAGFAAAQADMPVWLIVAGAVYGVLGTGFGFTAAGNINPPTGDGPDHRADD